MVFFGKSSILCIPQKNEHPQIQLGVTENGGSTPGNGHWGKLMIGDRIHSRVGLNRDFLISHDIFTLGHPHLYNRHISAYLGLSIFILLNQP